MSLPEYRHPPLTQTFLAHAVGTALLGFLMPASENLGWLHAWMRPIVELIPNALLITTRASDPVFAQTFIGLSLCLAFAILAFYLLVMRGYHTKTFETVRKRWTVLVYLWLTVIFCLSALWWMPYLDPLSRGRIHFLLLLATSGRFGIVTAMNQLVVGIPLLCLLTMWLAHSCTTVRNRTGFV